MGYPYLFVFRWSLFTHTFRVRLLLLLLRLRLGRVVALTHTFFLNSLLKIHFHFFFPFSCTNLFDTEEEILQIFVNAAVARTSSYTHSVHSLNFDFTLIFIYLFFFSLQFCGSDNSNCKRTRSNVHYTQIAICTPHHSIHSVTVCVLNACARFTCTTKKFLFRMMFRTNMGCDAELPFFLRCELFAPQRQNKQ